MDQLRRLMLFFEWPEHAARPVLEAMTQHAGGVGSLDSLPPGEFATLACRVAARLNREAEDARERAPVGDRIDNFIRVKDRISSCHIRTGAMIIDSESRSIGEDIAPPCGPPVVLVRKHIALVPTLAHGLIRLKPFPVRLVDCEILDEGESRALDVARRWMGGDPISTPEFNDLVGAILDTTDATEREARALAIDLGRGENEAPPFGILEFAEIASRRLDAQRRPATWSRRMPDLEPLIASSLDHSEFDPSDEPT